MDTTIFACTKAQKLHKLAVRGKWQQLMPLMFLKPVANTLSLPQESGVYMSPVRLHHAGLGLGAMLICLL